MTDSSAGSRGLTVAACAAGLAAAVAAWMIFVYAPVDDLQGVVQKIFYVHVASLITAYVCFATVLGASAVYVWRESPRADRLARAATPAGLVFTSVGLLMGIAWAQPVWGWNPTMAWDARFTSTVVLWAVYAGYLMVRRFATPGRDAARLGAVVGIAGFVDVPISYFSVQWWRGLHPGPVLAAAGGPQLPSTMLAAFVVTIVAILAVAGVLIAAAYRVEAMQDLLAADAVAEGERHPAGVVQPLRAR